LFATHVSFDIPESSATVHQSRAGLYDTACSICRAALSRENQMKSPHALTLIAIVFACHHGLAGAADGYPSRPVRLIVPYAPGGGSDITARAVGQKLGEALGQSFVVDNRPGASSMIGSEIVAKATPDGYTLIVADPAITINTVAYAKPRFDALRDFTPVALFAMSPQVLAANPSFGFGLKQLLAMPKAQTEKMAIGTTGQGPYMTYEWLRTKTGLTLNEVPYKGAAPALTDVMAGQIPLLMNPLAAVLTQLKAGKVKGLAIATAARHPRAPDIPTFQESGVKDFVVTHWYGALAPAGTPKEITVKLNREIAAALGSTEVRERFGALALDINPASVDDFRALIESELRRWKEVVAQTNIRIEQ
jgi:tripartite-type tricarboxylate transporter receptor subunit TctC